MFQNQLSNHSEVVCKLCVKEVQTGNSLLRANRHRIASVSSCPDISTRSNWSIFLLRHRQHRHKHDINVFDGVSAQTAPLEIIGL